ncbi:general substrate transporter [Saitoella complicata NRRL Y-17804]|uniref:Major facilitator superfamily (MFS) profile domain-containing protein n=1 Tax=Saitoella complicata (strain BCRC 22490 / CBS 7301 / JCM 7358 / NBRC 10748 / NRRL Y-17804) TaxID=698492 RepID=A0A0E9NNY0_SAICN|nr:general substrate transporter [Saitoella complicata NRRL Y-17804]ODQ55952.1 general substrate transporter [Saitoella complicata NRRL Y-17804]GAO51508.1 hypothetical protein G7K_5607-t1 [Saitoella complicata NRRL Y-17804]
MSLHQQHPFKPYFFGVRGSALITTITIASSSAFLLLGYDQGVLSGLLTGSHFLKVFNYPNAELTGTIVAIYDIGCLLGALFTAFYGEVMGRRRAALVGLSIMVVGATLQTSTFGTAQMIVARTVTGFGNGINAATIPMYNAEMVKPSNRGRLVSFQGSMIGFGIFISYWIDYGFSFTEGGIAWRVPIGLQLLFAGVTICLLWFLPESPRWLAAHGREDEAAWVLAQLEPKGTEVGDEVVQMRMREITTALTAEGRGGPVRWAECWENNKQQNRKRVLLACGINIFQQLSGCNALVYYIPVLLEQTVGLSRESSLLVGGLIGLVFFLFSAYPLIFLDKWGRPKPFIIASIVQSISMVLIAILLSTGNATAAKASVLFFFTYIAIFGTCYLGTPWLYGPELLPLRLRARGSALATGCNWICNFLIVEITPILISRIQWKTYILFACLNALWAPLLWLYYPDTARKSLEEIDALFTGEEVVGVRVGEGKGDVELELEKGAVAHVERTDSRRS